MIEKKFNEWNTLEFLANLEDLFTEKDAPSNVQTDLHHIKQGPRQHFAKFRSVFEQHCSETGIPAPKDVSKVNAMKEGLAPHLRKRLAYRSGTI
ncbi:hypothetical protein K3495_g9584 [Podosphaera aphanis]|nr:hypothetical protein K3495_g9584 [Podosphaera aphanis]